jgi:tetratricopeptide (TPR) repeat protein
MDNLTYIDNYFRGELTSEASAAFDEKVQQDPAFAEEVAFYCSTIQVASQLATTEKKQRFRELHHAAASPAKSTAVVKKWWRPYMSAAAVLAFLAIGWYLYMRPVPLQQLADTYIKENFTTVSVHMSAQEDSLDMAKRLYNENKLAESLAVLEEINRNNNTSDEAKKIAGVVSLRLKEYDKAVLYFTQLEQLTLYDNPGKLYHALALIKRNRAGDVASAKQLLQQIVALNLAQKETAERWLKAF